MGTGHVVKRAAPDLLSGVSQSHSSSSDGSLVSMETVVTPANSELSDVRDIIRDLADTDHAQPLIGHSSPAKPSWSVNNPYLHTSAPPPLPYLLYRQRLAVRPDQQYPILSYQFTDQHAHTAPFSPVVAGENPPGVLREEEDKSGGVSQDMELVLERMVNTCWGEGTKI